MIRAALSAGMLTTTLLPETLTDCGLGLNDPLALTPEPAILMAVDESDGAVRTYSVAEVAAEARVMVTVIADVPLLFTITFFPIPQALVLELPEIAAEWSDPAPASFQRSSP